MKRTMRLGISQGLIRLTDDKDGLLTNELIRRNLNSYSISNYQKSFNQMLPSQLIQSLLEEKPKVITVSSSGSSLQLLRDELGRIIRDTSNLDSILRL